MTFDSENDPNRDNDLIEPAMKKLLELPEKWGKNQREMRLNLIAPREDAIWIFARILEDVDDDVLSASFNVTHSEFSIEADIVLNLNVNVDLNLVLPTLSALLLELKTRTISKWLKHRRKKRNREKDNS